MMNNEIKRAFEEITLSDESRERMLKEIMTQSSVMKQEASAKRETTPWYIRFKTPIGFCGAAMACALMFTIAVSNPAVVSNNNDRQQIVATQPVTITTTVPAVTTALPESSRTELAAVQTTASLRTTEAVSKTITVTEATSNVTTAETVISPTVKPAVSSLTTTGTSAELITTATVTEVTTQVVSSTTVEVTTTGTTFPSLYGNYFDFNHVTWAGRSYATDYVETDYAVLADCIGSGVATGDEAMGSYTILLYRLDGVPVERGFAVQYAGQTAYYIFYSVE